jgi:hypothetical protein
MLIAGSPQNHERVDERIPDENRITRYQLHPSGHPARIDQWSDVVLDKPTFIASLSCEAAKPVFHWREWTDVAEKVHERGPQDRWDVKPGDPAFPEHKEATQDRKDDKGEVNAQHKICQYTRFHLFTP